jgi:D-arginine dehydrogenase
MLLGGPGEEATAEADIDTMALVPISPEEARARVPILDPEHVTRAGYHEAAWDIDTDRMVQHFARTIRSNGGEVHAGNRSRRSRATAPIGASRHRTGPGTRGASS